MLTSELWKFAVCNTEATPRLSLYVTGDPGSFMTVWTADADADAGGIAIALLQ